MAKNMTDSNSTPTHQQITQRAYEIFIERGQPQGQDLAHWLEAEKQLQASQNKNSASNSAQSSSAQTSSASAQPASAPIRATQPATQSSGSNGRTQGNGGNGRSQARVATKK